MIYIYIYDIYIYIYDIYVYDIHMYIYIYLYSDTNEVSLPQSAQ